MDTSTRYISFNSENYCNYCTNMIKQLEKIKNNALSINNLISKIKKGGFRKKYDCIVGLSGGVDSASVLLDVVQRGLRPLAVHMDNGWNSELAQSNIENLVKSLNVDLFTYVIDWAEYRAILTKMIELDILDLELLYDNAMLAINFNLAHKYGIKYILSGYNVASEGISIPRDWAWMKYDSKNIRYFAKLAGIKKLKSFPSFGVLDYLFSRLSGINWVPYLDYIDYNKQKFLNKLESQVNFKSYSHKHYESIFTRFYQGYILPKKFNIDKRLPHFSALIISSQMNRSEAIELLDKNPYPSEELLNEDIEYICKKLRMSKLELENYIQRSPTDHDQFPSEINLWKFYLSFRNKVINLKKKLWSF